MTTRTVIRAAALEFALTAIMLFVVVTATRWVMGTVDRSAGGWWNTTPARLLVLAPIAGYPARQFGPAILSGVTAFLPAYLLAPPLGAFAATVMIKLLARRLTGGVRSAARRPSGPTPRRSGSP